MPTFVYSVTTPCRLRAVLLTLTLASTLGCPRVTELRVAGQAARGRPVFATYGSKAALGILEVTRCERSTHAALDTSPAVWRITAVSPLGAVVDRVVYGAVPRGFILGPGRPHGSRGPAPSTAPPLGAGCYRAARDGTGQTWFTVAADGSVLELAGPPAEDQRKPGGG